MSALLVVTACTEQDPSDDSSATPPATETAQAGTADLEELSIDTPVAEQAQWVLEQLRAGSGPDADVAAGRFSDTFLAHVPAEDVADTFDSLRSLGTFVIDDYDGTEHQAQIDLTTEDGSSWQMHVELDNDGLIDTLFVQAASEVPDISSWEDLDEALTDTGADFGLYAVRDDDGTWEVIHEHQSAQARPIGSIFKLYVLGAVQQSVLGGDLSWDDDVTVTDDVRSLPTGELQDAEPGTSVSVAEAAEKMISISDNTATDILIDLVGRESVEAAVSDMGHDEPALLTPFITTRELFQLGWSDPELPRAWQGADTDERRRMLEELPGGVLDVDPGGITEAVWPYGVGWFASGPDLAAAHHALHDMAADDDSGTVRAIMAVNPGVPVDPDAWPYAGFKGGGAPGVYALSWLLEDPDGVRHVFVMQLATDEPGALADERRLAAIAAQGLELLSDG
ncbi:serine hydrolase [Phytoactinopolyspora mesophila]|uniref:serine hydrolase n=1 Tax=Phytoactinopolyspora mesophila TaxID=2650750 RepID=UPI001390BB51